MANSADPDQTAPLGAVWSGSALFAHAIKNLGVWYFRTFTIASNEKGGKYIFDSCMSEFFPLNTFILIVYFSLRNWDRKRTPWRKRKDCHYLIINTVVVDAPLMRAQVQVMYFLLLEYRQRLKYTKNFPVIIVCRCSIQRVLIWSI